MEIHEELRRVAKAVSDALPPGETPEFYRGYNKAAVALNDAIGPCGCGPEAEVNAGVKTDLAAEIRTLRDQLSKQQALLGETQGRLENRIKHQAGFIEALREALVKRYEFDLGRLVDHVRKLKSEAQTEAEVRAVQEIGKLFMPPPPLTPKMVERLRGARCETVADVRHSE